MLFPHGDQKKGIIVYNEQSIECKDNQKILEKTKGKAENETISCQLRDMKGAPACWVITGWELKESRKNQNSNKMKYEVI